MQALDTVETLLAKEQIRDLVRRYFRGADRLDWDLVRTCFHPDARDEHGLYVGDVEGLIEFFSRWSAEQYVSAVHLAGQISVDLQDDRAVAETYCVSYLRMTLEKAARSEFARFVAPGRLEDVISRAGAGFVDLTLGLRIIDRFERRAGDWRIAHRFVVHEWNRLDPVSALMEADASSHQGRRDQSDLIYAQISKLRA